MHDHGELGRLRAQMDTINRRLAAVLHERAALCRRIGACKRSQGLAGPDPAREQAMRDALLRDLPADGFARDDLAAILDAVFTRSRALVERATR
jgi:chorismate mutase